VDAGASLTIFAGVEVRFEGVWTLTVNGVLRVQGELGSPVIFRQNQTSATTQFVIGGSGVGSMNIVQTVLDNGGVFGNGTMRLTADGLEIRCNVSGCGDAIHLQEVSDAVLHGVTIDYATQKLGTAGLVNSGPRLVLDTFSIQNTQLGIQVDNCDVCSIANGTVSGLDPTIEGLRLTGNDSAIINLRFPSGPHIQIHAEGNRNVLRGNHLTSARSVGLVVGGDNVVIEANVIESPGSTGISVYRTTNALIRNNQVLGARFRGIEVTHGAQPAYGSVVLDNYVEGLGAGILSEQTQGIIRGNTLRGNGVGVELRLGSNQVDHNHFEFNTLQARDTAPGNVWDDGYPSGGNWWSDYLGDDVYSGPLQNLPGADGIGDAPYVIDADSRDRYPFYTVPAPGVPPGLTAAPLPGGFVRLTWRAAPMADSYYVYASRTPTGFDFGAPIRLGNVTEWIDFAAGAPGPHYYVLRAHNTTVDRTGATSHTVGAWRTAFPAWQSTVSLPLAPYPWVDYTATGWVDTAGEFVAATGATSFAYMEAGRWRYVPGDGNPNRTLRPGAGYIVDFAATTSTTLVGLPAATIDYATWPPYPLTGFDPATTARELAATATGDDVVLTWPSLVEIPTGNGTYQVFASNKPGGLRGEPGVDYELLATVPATAAATVAYRHVGALRSDFEWYYEVVPVRAVYLRGASTYSVGVISMGLASGYSAIGLPLRPFENGSYVAWNVSSLSASGVPRLLWFDLARLDWVAHAAWMAAGTYDTPFTMIMAVQIDPVAPIRLVFSGV